VLRGDRRRDPLIPLTGLTTPFLAAGGSSLLANWIIVALLLVISNAARRPVDMSPLGPDDAEGPEDSRFADLADRMPPPRRRGRSDTEETQTEAVRIR
jgi:hypothetical protein